MKPDRNPWLSARYDDCLKVYGRPGQLTTAIEEASEFIKEICKIKRGEGSTEKIAEEIADLGLMLDELAYYFDLDAQILEIQDFKIKRLVRRLTRDKKLKGL